MKNQKKVIEIINQFLSLLCTLKKILKSGNNVDYILDASDHHQPVALPKVAGPDILLVRIKILTNAGIGDIIRYQQRLMQ